MVKVPRLELNCFAARKMSRKTRCTVSSASPSSLSIALAVWNTKALCRSNRTARASLHPAHSASMRSASVSVRSREATN